MPRRAPINPTACYHVSTRGNYGAPLFRTRDECRLYLHLYARAAAKFAWRTLSWCLIWNHNHFLIELSDGGLTEGMRAINHGFSRRMNAAHDQTGRGHLVRHGFFADEITSDAHLASVSRYIDLNPVAAARCERPEDWDWSGYAATLGLDHPQPFHDPLRLLRHFGSTPERARIAYRRFVLQPEAQEAIPGKGYRSVTAAGAWSGVVRSGSWPLRS